MKQVLDGISSNKRIAKNTLLLYVRMLIVVSVQLCAVPIVLHSLGVEDYGIYNVVGGIVTMFSFLGGSLASGTQRFMAFELGKQELHQLKMVFNTTVTIYLCFGLVAFILLEVAGTWFLNTKMEIPIDRIYAANWVFQLSLVAFLVNLLSIPYNAAVIAHERMNVLAYMSVLECMFKLAAALFLSYSDHDCLIVYAVLLCLISVAVRIIYQLYCRFQFDECKYVRYKYSHKIGKEMLIYSGWNTIGMMATLFRQQGINVLMNLFFGTVLNAAHSLAQHINGVVTQFVNNVYTATRPTITKLYATGKTEEMWILVFRSSRLAFYLLLLFCVPVIFEIDTVLKLWLRSVPEYTANITRLIIVSLLIETLVNQISSVFQTVNRVKAYQTASATILLFNIPLTYFLLKYVKANPFIPYMVSISLSMVFAASVIWNAYRILHLDVARYCQEVLYKVFIVSVLFSLIIALPVSLFQPSFFRLLITSCTACLGGGLVVWSVGINSEERFATKKIFSRVLNHENAK